MGLLLSQLLLSCQPKGTVEVDHQTLSVLKDLYLADALVLKQPSHLRDSLRKLYVNQIGEIHDLSRDEIDSVVMSVQGDLTKYKDISDSLMKEINKKSEQLEKLPAKLGKK